MTLICLAHVPCLMYYNRFYVINILFNLFYTLVNYFSTNHFIEKECYGCGVIVTVCFQAICTISHFIVTLKSGDFVLERDRMSSSPSTSQEAKIEPQEIYLVMIEHNQHKTFSVHIQQM